MSRQRSLQNGRNGELDHSISRLHVGHLTSVGTASIGYAQQLSRNGTSTSDCVGRVARPFQLRKRTLHR